MEFPRGPPSLPANYLLFRVQIRQLLDSQTIDGHDLVKRDVCSDSKSRQAKEAFAKLAILWVVALDTTGFMPVEFQFHN
jgi:hypothetical protein